MSDNQNPFDQNNDNPFQGNQGAGQQYQQQNQYGQQFGGNTPQQPLLYNSSGRSYDWQEVWQLIITDPSPESFEEILGDPQASMNRGLVWVAIAFTISGILSLIAQAVFGAALFSFGATDLGAQQAGNIFINIICLPVFIVIGIAFYMAIQGVFHVVAQMLGGKGSYEAYIYANASYYAPITIISAVLGIVPILGSLAQLLLSVFALVLAVMCVKAVYKLEWLQSVATIFLPIIVILVPLFCCFGTLILGAIGAS